MSVLAIPTANKLARTLKARTATITVPAANKGVRAPAPLTDPTTLPNIAGWYRADSGITIATGVSQWKDLSSNNKDYAQAGGTAQPLYVLNGVNGQPTIRFDGVNDVLTGSLIAARAHIFAVIKQVAAADQPWLAQGDTTNGLTVAWLTGVVKFNEYIATVNAGNGQTCSATSDTSFHVIDLNGFATASSKNVVLYDGQIKDTAVDGTGGYGPNGNAIGSNGAATFANVEIAELIIYSAQKAQNERALLYAYLKTRYGL